jgi:hypothetical protein
MIVIPSTAVMAGADTISFQAVEQGAPLAAVTWAIEPPKRGKITKGGVYTAPKVRWISKSVVIVATSNGESATATVSLSVAHTWIGALSLYWVALCSLLLWGAIYLWPRAQDPLKDPLPALKLIAVCGALGGVLHGVVSMVAYVGSMKFAPSWGPYYVFQPFVAAMAALMVYLVPGSSSVDTAAKVSVQAGVAVLVGAFSDLALQKLKEVFDALIGPKTDPRAQKLQSATPAKPAISNLSPTAIPHGTTPPITISGSGFSDPCSVKVNGAPRATIRHSDTSVTAALTAADVAAPVSLRVTVANSNGDSSNALVLSVT